VFVIAPTDVTVQVRATDAPVLRFCTSPEFQRLRRESSPRVAAAVYAALAELNVEPASCSPRTQEVLAGLCQRETIPSVKEMFAACSSRRSFYRSWNDDVPETPAAFLTRVRLLDLLKNSSESQQRDPQFGDAAQGGTSDPATSVR
jgi:hypothetical protein